MTFGAGESLVTQIPSIQGNARGARPQAQAESRSELMSENDILKRRIAQLEERVEELDAFAFSVSHDLRAPLRMVNSYARILEEDHAGELTAMARSCVTKIVRATRDMDRLIEDMLALSRFDSQPAAMTLINSSALVDQVLTDVATEQTDRIQVTVGSLGHCLGNAGLLRQVWTNLLSNALKFTRERNPALIEIGSVTRNHIITYFVRDNGVGFDVSRARDLFLPFRRFHDQSQYEGQGIGLSIVRRIVARHGGRLWAESRPDEGATFYFTLPRS